jgi:chemotaxis protein MotC
MAIDAAIPAALLPPDMQQIYGGALAYGLGADDKARKLIGGLDARAMPSGLGGHLALVQATLFAATDKPRAIALLDLARLLEPGTLVEEAALRREMLLVDAGTGDLAKFTGLARRYAAAFPRSLYFTNFRQMLTEAAVDLGASGRVDATARLRSVIASLSVADRRRLLLAVARNALLAGRLDMAVFASDEAGRLARKGEPDEGRAMVLFGAAAIATPQYDAGRRALAEAARLPLDSGDGALRQSALAVADMIRNPAFGAQPARGEEQAALFAEGDRSLALADTTLKLVAK